MGSTPVTAEYVDPGLIALGQYSLGALSICLMADHVRRIDSRPDEIHRRDLIQ